jgi:hypothetical protein
MANNRKTRDLKLGLAELDQQEKDYMENLANSLLKLQNVDFPEKSGEMEGEKTSQKQNLYQNAGMQNVHFAEQMDEEAL